MIYDLQMQILDTALLVKRCLQVRGIRPHELAAGIAVAPAMLDCFLRAENQSGLLPDFFARLKLAENVFSPEIWCPITRACLTQLSNAAYWARSMRRYPESGADAKPPGANPAVFDVGPGSLVAQNPGDQQ